MQTVIEGIINRGAGSVLFGGKSMRGPLRTADFIYEIMINVALEMTDRIPMFFEDCRQDYEKKQKWNEQFTTKGKYTDTYGWSPDREFKHDIDINPTFFNYFNRIIVPFLGGKKKAYNDENSKIWKYIKKIILSGDKEKITRLQTSIRKQIMREAQKKINIATVGINGADDSNVGGAQIIPSSNIQ